MRTLILFSLLLAACAAHGQSTYTAKDIIEKELLYSFEGGSRLITIHSDSTLSWKDGGHTKAADEKTKTVHVSEQVFITSWYNAEKTFVTMYTDLEKMTFVFTVCWPDGKFYPLQGKISMRD